MSFYNNDSSALRKRKTLKKGIQFTVMVVGQSGTGRSTFINTLCGQNIVETSSTVNEDAEDGGLQLRHEAIELEDSEGLKISLNIIDTPGFANAIDCEKDFSVINDYIRYQYDEILLEESRVKRNPRFKDGRIHCLVYLINPTGHGLKELDVKFLSKVNNLVNIIPVISKADSLTHDELLLNKRLILEDLNQYKINYYKYLYDNEFDDEELVEYTKYLNQLTPFSIIGANDYKTLPNGEIVRIRKLRHGDINVEDETTNDFSVLRNVLLVTHLNDFKEITHEHLYERYRTEALSNNGASNDNLAEFENGASVEDKDNMYTVREEQIKLEEERLKKFEERVQNDLVLKRKELLQREKELKEIEMRLEMEAMKLEDED